MKCKMENQKGDQMGRIEYEGQEFRDNEGDTV